MWSKIKQFLLILVGVFLLVSCTREVPEPAVVQPGAASNYETLVDAANPWFANLGAFDSPQTKVDESMQDLRALSSLLDFSDKTTVTISGRNFTQTAFLSNAGRQFFCEASDVTMPEKISLDSVFVAKKYLIKSGDGEEMLEYVVTMLVRWNYCEEYGYDNISYLNRPNFSGYIVFSDPDCTYNYISYYDNGRLYKAEFESFQDSKNAAGTSNTKNIFAFSIASTKVEGVVDVDGGEIEGAVCCAEKPKRVTTEEEKRPEDPTEYIGSGLGGSFAGEKGPGYKDKGGGSGDGGDFGGDNKSVVGETSSTTDDNETMRKVAAEKERLYSLLKDKPITDSVGGYSGQMKALMKDFAEVAAVKSLVEGWDLPSKILSGIKLDLLKFAISNDKNVNPNTVWGRGATSHKTLSLKVIITTDKIDDQKIFGHELLHCVQYSDDNNVINDGEKIWRTGDQEFEAFVLEVLMMAYDFIGMIYEETSITNVMNYYRHPNKDTYLSALRAYRNEKPEYNNSNFPITENMTPGARIVHLNSSYYEN